MNVISMIDRKIKGFPLWSKGKVYKIFKTERATNRVIVYIKDDAGKMHWMPIGENFIILKGGFNNGK